MLFNYHNSISKHANDFGLPFSLVEAIINVESGGNHWATRYEPHYSWLWDIDRGKPFRDDQSRLPAPSYVSHSTELMGQKTSWGLMQVMGAVAREYGFSGRFLVELCDPDTGVFYGCKHINKLKLRYFDEFGWRGVAAAYNAGSPRIKNSGFINQPYVDKIEKFGGFENA